MSTGDGSDESFERAAQRHYDGEMADIKKAIEQLDEADKQRLGWREDDALREHIREEVGEPLSVEFKLTATVQILLGTGGPARGYEIEIDENGDIEGGCYWYQDWFKEKRRFPLDDDEIQQVARVYDIDLEDYCWRIKRMD